MHTLNVHMYNNSKEHSKKMAFEVFGKIALVTGGAEGIGYYSVKNLLENGANGVVIADLNEELGIKAEGDLNTKFENRVKFIKTNVAVREELDRAFQETCKHFRNLDIVVNNAGICNDFELDLSIATNFSAVAYSTSLAMETYLPIYRSTAEGIIVNISSITGFSPFSSTPIYSATKAAVLNLGRALGHEAIYKKFRVKVITICPGFTDTKMIVDPTVYFPEARPDRREFKMQQAGIVGGFLSKIIRWGSNGSVWIVDGGEAFRAKFPSLEEVKENAVKFEKF